MVSRIADRLDEETLKKLRTRYEQGQFEQQQEKVSSSSSNKYTRQTRVPIPRANRSQSRSSDRKDRAVS